jgi:lipopolysaccharide assembly outer membrane protein LptD (OstA)
MWQLKAQRAERLDRDRSIALNGITGQLFDRRPGQSAGTGQRAIRIQAQSGRAMPESRRLELKDRVRAESSDFKVALEANEAVWLPEQHRLTAQGNVVVTQTERGVVLTGDRLQANLTANRLELRNDNPEKPIRARSDDPPLDLSVAELDWDLEKQQVNARGDAIVLHRDEKIRLQGETLTFLLPTNQLTLNGQVYVQSDAEGDRLWADRLDWVVGSETATATGNVRYEQPDRDVTVVGTAGTANWTTHTFAVEGPSTLTQLTLP